MKKEVFSLLDGSSSSSTIIASSSSGLLITEIQKVMKYPQRSLIANPFNPPHLVPLVELVPGTKTDPEIIRKLYDFYKGLGKIPVILKKEVPGPIANRLATALWREAIDLVGGGEGGYKHFIEHLGKGNINKPDYPRRAVEELERCYRMGARGIGELTDKGLGLTGDPELDPGERLHPNDPRLDPFWKKAAELNLPVNIHIADHPSAWQPPDVFQERTPVFQQFNRHGTDGLSYGDLISSLPRLLNKHPGTTFIACHLVNQGNDLGSLARTIDTYPNLYLDISVRDYELGRTPRAAKEFINKYRDRVLFGTDMGMDKSMYQAWWRLLESDNEYITGRIWWPYYGLGMPAHILEKIYRTNAMQILNWEKV